MPDPEPPSPPRLTGGLRLELLSAVCPVRLAHAGRPEVGAGTQDGRQVDAPPGLLSRLDLLAGRGAALERESAPSWGRKARRRPAVLEALPAYSRGALPAPVPSAEARVGAQLGIPPAFPKRRNLLSDTGSY